MPPSSVHELSRVIGALEEGVRNLGQSLDEERKDAKQHRQSLREVIAAQTEAMRTLTARMDQFTARLDKIEPIIDDYQTRRHEAAGRAKLGRWLTAFWMGVSGTVVALITWLLSHWKGVTGAIFVVALIATATVAFSEDHQHPPQDAALHEAFYSTWRVPNGGKFRGSSCCNKRDCYPAEIKSQAGQVFFLHRETKQWKIIPQGIIEANQPDPRESPDGQSHVCASPTGAVYCAVLGGGI